MTTSVSGGAGNLPEHLRSLLDDYLRALDFSASEASEAAEAEGTEALVDAMRYSLLAGGKRIRGVLALACCEALGDDPQRLLPTAAAIELIHTYSLIHDDLPAMDDDDLRRGQPTCHRVYGEDVAILAGDALFAEAVRLVCERQAGGAEVQVKIISELSRASGVNGMVGGQFLDLRGSGRTSPEALRRVHMLKTGRLIACAVHCAVALADPPPEVELAYRAFARELGLLFQIVNDILDVAGSTEALGKAVGSDVRQDKATYVSMYGLERARELAVETHARTSALLASIPGPVGDLQAAADLIHVRQS